MSDHLLPPSATAQERALSETIARISDVPVLVRESWNPETCPVELLPWLAWAFSVDEWDAAWSEAEKRDVVAQSYNVHRHKGTIDAMERALRPLGYLIDVKEWWEEETPTTPFTFKVVIGTTTKPVEESLYPKLERMIMASKNLRSQLTGITVKSDVSGQVYCGSTAQFGSTISVYPYQGEDLEIAGPLYYGAGMQIIGTISVRPQA
ncbi:putative tail protein I [Pseudomonas phage PPpW-3]|uniref:Putative tail protein I n=1 Tax=Pseudomonas phage PPpW-3 TaxID=1279082 RepID=V5YTN0_9CAUD|nr:tail protein [Pseudomonas phage PPpW-3]BAO20614.1 putative tail protein I [Pseudomonas phage PPpW-3]